MTRRAHSPVGTLPTALECPRSSRQPPAEVPLLAASAIRARIVPAAYFLLCRVAVRRPRVAGAIARFTDAREAAVPRHAPGHLRRPPRGLLSRHRRPAGVP